MNNAPVHGENTSSRQLADVLTDPRGASVAELTFGPDLLGPDFGVHYVEMGDDPDGETPVRFALVRYSPTDASGSTAATPASDQAYKFYARPALLFVHGMTDYFFQDHVARYFHEAGYAVYAIDMRKCGRAWREDQTWHHVTSQAIYDEDLSIALGLIGTAHPTVVPVGHSTGGLDVTTWAGRLNAAAQRDSAGAEAGLHGMLGAVVGNSP